MGKQNMTSTYSTGLRIVAVACLAAWSGLAFADRMDAETFRDTLDMVEGYTITEGEHPFTEELEAIDRAINASHGDEALRAAQAAALAEFLAREDTGRDAKWYAARHLHRIAGPGEVELVAPLLTEPGTSDIAVYALQDIPGSEAAQALIDALDAPDSAVRIGVINALAARGDSAALPALDALAPVLTAAGAENYTAAQQEEVAAALHAIAAIGSGEASGLLQDRLDAIANDPDLTEAPRNFFLPYYHAWMTLAAAQLAAGEREPAQVLQVIGRLPMPGQMNTGIELALARHFAEILPRPREIIANDDVTEEGKRGYLWRIESAGQLANLAADTPHLPPDYQILALNALAERRVSTAAAPAAQLVDSPNTEVRVAALTALGQVGGAEDVPLLLENAASGTADIARAAAGALALLRGDEVHDAIVSEMQRAGSGERVAALEALAARRATDRLDTFWDATEDDDADVRAAAFSALGALGGHDTAVRVARAAAPIADSGTRTAALSAMVALARRTGSEAEVVEAVLDGLDADAGEDAHTAVAEALGRLNEPAALPFLIDTAQSGNPAIQMAGIRALTDWPTAGPLEPLLEIAETSEDRTRSILALRAAIGIVDTLPSEQEQVAAYRRALAIDSGAQEKRRVLGGLARLSNREALALAESFLDDEELRDDAKFAVGSIWANTSTPSASRNTDDAALALNGDGGTRWTTGQLQQPGQWFQLSFDEPTPLAAIVLNSANSPNDYPRGYAVYVSDDGEDWGEPIATGEGSESVTRIEFEPVTANAIRIEQTGTADAHFWSIHTLEIETHE